MSSKSNFVLEFFRKAGSKTPDLRLVPLSFQLSNPGLSGGAGGWGGLGGSTSKPDLKNATFWITDNRVITALWQAVISGQTFARVNLMEEWMSGKTQLRVTAFEMKSVAVAGLTQSGGGDGDTAGSTFSLIFDEVR